MALLRSGGGGKHSTLSVLFPGFRDVAEIGFGSIATVYRAKEESTGRAVALKLLNVRDVSPRAVESFERESHALGALGSHPNIVTLYRTFRTPDGRPVLVLELCTAAVSDQLQRGVPIPPPEAVAIGIKVAGALETAHRAGVLHRDVKPQNILITEFREPALADFGVAMLQTASQTSTGLFDFTTLHAAPELLEGTGTSAATDVYELASSLYQLLSGQSAFRAYEGESPASVILRILRDPVNPLGPAVPRALSEVLVRAMSKDPGERPQTAAQFAQELTEVEIAQGWPRTKFLVRSEPDEARSVQKQPPQKQAAQKQPAQKQPLPPEPVLKEALLVAAPLATASVGDLEIDPTTLRPSMRIRAGLDSLRVDADQLVIRTGLSKQRVRWSDVLGIETSIEGGTENLGHAGSVGFLFVRTEHDAVELPATRRPAAQLHHLHAMLEAYRRRARSLANG